LFQQECELSYANTISLETLIEESLSKKAHFKSMNAKCSSAWKQRPLGFTHHYLMVRDTALLIDLLNFYKEDHMKTVTSECESYIFSIRKDHPAAERNNSRETVNHDADTSKVGVEF
jgi:hypothetical protein